jgi:hypothetical protein
MNDRAGTKGARTRTEPALRSPIKRQGGEKSLPSSEPFGLRRPLSPGASPRSPRGSYAGCGMRGAGCGMRDAGCGMRDAGCGMRDAGCGMRDAGCGTRDAGCGMRDAGCGMRDAGCGMRDAGCGMRDAGRGMRDAQPVVKRRAGRSRFALARAARRETTGWTRDAIGCFSAGGQWSSSSSFASCRRARTRQG